VIDVLIDVGVFPGTKAILKLLGVDCGACRRPFAQLTSEQQAKVEKIVASHIVPFAFTPWRPRLKPLDRPPSVHHSVQSALRHFIIDNNLQAGDPFARGTLARELGVGRNSVREGIKALESLGAGSQARRRCFCQSLHAGALAGKFALHLRAEPARRRGHLQIRSALEVSLIEEVVNTISAEQLDTLQKITEAMAIKARRGEDFSDEDSAFHQALFAPLGNAMLLALNETFWRVFYKVAGPTRLETQDPLKTWEDHVAIVDAVAARDVLAAKQRLEQRYASISTRLRKRREQVKT
jgi:DNA-binding FadR family transcriptional regulator